MRELLLEEGHRAEKQCAYVCVLCVSKDSHESTFCLRMLRQKHRKGVQVCMDW